jgi:hypothetical protein
MRSFLPLGWIHQDVPLVELKTCVHQSWLIQTNPRTIIRKNKFSVKIQPHARYTDI